MRSCALIFLFYLHDHVIEMCIQIWFNFFYYFVVDVFDELYVQMDKKIRSDRITNMYNGFNDRQMACKLKKPIEDFVSDLKNKYRWIKMRSRLKTKKPKTKQQKTHTETYLNMCTLYINCISSINHSSACMHVTVFVAHPKKHLRQQIDTLNTYTYTHTCAYIRLNSTLSGNLYLIHLRSVFSKFVKYRLHLDFLTLFTHSLHTWKRAFFQPYDSLETIERFCSPIKYSHRTFHTFISIVCVLLISRGGYLSSL